VSYQALARRWRPKTFAELTGQEHVVAALTGALDRGRLHHAYLLTGTRGIGKTTIARILAKSLNCLTNGVSSTPCGTCAACVDIDAGRFVDLLELDAASNTGIDNMREILDNARYAPTVGRYKVYLIDEVHMLSKAAFNSMLKTLEEPPEHVKFVLATTDPQKIPVTVLSRCLQFNLKPLPVAQIAARLTQILAAEKIESDAIAIDLIARAARGSLRDALSLLDQAIAHGGGSVREESVRAMLGAAAHDFVYRIADALVAGDGAALIAESDTLAANGWSPAAALDELAGLFYRIAVAQALPQAAAQFDDAARVTDYAAKLSREAVQLGYQIASQGREDLKLAPDEATGFAMTLLRLWAFEPASSEGSGEGTQRSAPPVAQALPRSAPGAKAQPAASNVATMRAAAAASPASTSVTTTREENAAKVALPADVTQWPQFVASLKLTGMAAQLAAQTEQKSLEGNVLTLKLAAAQKHLADRTYADKLKGALEAATGRKLLLAFEVGDATESSLAAQQDRARTKAKEEGERAFREEPFVRDLLSRFDATIKPDTITPIDGDKPR
jgi:DNA polymerase-3 subunit gamma/tau